MITVALIGNPNCGKTTTFNKLTGSTQRVGNWPGVTVERKQGYIRDALKDQILVVDLPGIYSLSPYTPEEVVSRDYLVGSIRERPDVAVNIIDASNLERGLYLLTQVADLGIPMVVILNMMDVAERSGMKVDSKALAGLLRCEVVEAVGIRSSGTREIAEAIQRAYDSNQVPNRITYSPEIERCIEGLTPILSETVRDELVRWAALKLIEGDTMVRADLGSETLERCRPVIEALEEETGSDGMQIVAASRYAVGESIQKGCMKRIEAEEIPTSLSDRIDRVLLNRYAALPIFALVMYLVYFITVQTIGMMGSDYINGELVPSIQDYVSDALLGAGVDTVLTDLVVSGVIGGVGAVLGFIPLIVVLFLLLTGLEECGYMVRVAYMLDRLFTYFGLSGKAVIPAIVGIGCGVPAIMGTRTIEDQSDRNVSIMCTTFMPCSAKLPIITVIVGAFFGASALVTASLYLLGIVMILLSGLVLKKFTGFVGEPSPFVMELPVYHYPTPKNVVMNVAEKTWDFVQRAGTIILLCTVVLWLMASYSITGEYVGNFATADSILATIGKAICWVFTPLGFGGDETWQLSVASITGILAKENLLTSVAVLIGSAVDAEDMPTKAALVEYLSGMQFPAAVAMSFLIFNLICAPCIAAIATMHREFGSWRKTLIAIFYQCVTAYGVAGIFYQTYALVHGEIGLGLLWLALFIVVPVYIVLSKDPLWFLRGKRTVKAVN